MGCIMRFVLLLKLIILRWASESSAHGVLYLDLDIVILSDPRDFFSWQSKQPRLGRTVWTGTEPRHPLNEEAGNYWNCGSIFVDRFSGPFLDAWLALAVLCDSAFPCPLGDQSALTRL